MSESFQGAKNEKALASFELGRTYLLDAYDTAREHDPRLDEIAIVPVANPAYATIARTIPKWSSLATQERHEVHLRRGNPARTLAHCQKIADRDPTSFSIISERIGIDPHRLTPALNYTFTALHEFGHGSSLLDDDDESPGDGLRRIHKEWSTLPYYYAPPSAIANPRDPVRQRIERDWDAISNDLGIWSITELVMRQAVAYRDMRSEANADYFAVEVLDDNPKFMDMLLADRW